MDTAAQQLREFIEEERLPASFFRQAEQFFLPFIAQRLPAIRTGDLRVLGIHGAQGSGKSTLASLYQRYLESLGLRVAQLSLDDFYLTRAQRQALAEQRHPLLKTRGVPGTHDVALGLSILESLRGLPKQAELALPRFDKLNDDRYPEADWPVLTGCVDLIIFEGWCLGVAPQAEPQLQAPVNTLESEEDGDGSWRHFVNEQLKGPYQHWFAEIDYLLMLRAPSFDCVASWRLEQEQRLAAKQDARPAMNAGQVQRFVQHYQRLTEHALATLPAQADCVMALDENRQIHAVHYWQARQ